MPGVEPPPGLMDTEPLWAELLVPAERRMLPASPPAAAPVVSDMEPDTPAAVDPVEIAIHPLAPAEEAAWVDTVSVPEEDDEPAPVNKLTLPPT